MKEPSTRTAGGRFKSEAYRAAKRAVRIKGSAKTLSEKQLAQVDRAVDISIVGIDPKTGRFRQLNKSGAKTGKFVIYEYSAERKTGVLVNEGGLRDRLEGVSDSQLEADLSQAIDKAMAAADEAIAEIDAATVAIKENRTKIAKALERDNGRA
jgi:hypothetical protein